MASTELPSTPRVAKRSAAASRRRWRVPARRSPCVAITQKHSVPYLTCARPPGSGTSRQPSDAEAAEQQRPGQAGEDLRTGGGQRLAATLRAAVGRGCRGRGGPRLGGGLGG